MRIALVIVILLIAVIMDLSFRKIKNGLIIAGLAAGICVWVPFASVESGKDLLAGVILPILICWIPFLMHALGAGDIKLFSVIGCLYGGRDVVYCIGFSFLIAAGFSLAKLLKDRKLWTSLINCFRYFQQIFTKGKITPYSGRKEPDHLIHFSVAILLGFVVLMGVKYCKIAPLY